MEIVNFPALAIGSTFVVDGETFTKRTALTFTDYIGIEHYIDPLFDAKLGQTAQAAAQAVDTSAKIVEGEKEQ